MGTFPKISRLGVRPMINANYIRLYFCTSEGMRNLVSIRPLVR
jgi:hypothetical protein